MPESNFLYFNPRQSTNTTDSNTPPQSTTSVTTDAPTLTPSGSQTSTITTIQLSDTQSGSSQATSIGFPTSSSTTPQPTSSPDVGTTSSAVTTSSQPELTPSSSLISSTSPETSSSALTSQPPTSTILSVPSSSQTPTSSPAPTTTTSSSPSPSPSPSSISQNKPTPTTPTATYGGQTTSTITSSFVTVIGSSSISTFSLIPTVISLPSNTTTGETDRTAIIASSVIGGGLVLILGLSVFFYRQRQRFKHFHFLDAINVRRRQARARATLLAGEDLEDVDLARPPPGRYSDYDAPWDPRDSSGSINDTERGKLMGSVVHGGDVDLSHIVDDVMGPSASGVHYSQNSLSSSYHDLSGHESTPQTRERPNASQIALIEAAGLSTAGGPGMQPTRPSPLGNNDPVVTGGGNTL